MKKKRAKPSAWYQFKAETEEEGVAELRIFGPIGGGYWLDEEEITGKAISKRLDGLGENIKTIRVFVNSPGGSVFDGIHIANALRRQREEHGRNVAVEIEALAASAATLITSAGSTVRMPRNALMMIHNPIGWAEGPKAVMLEVADVLERAARAIVATYRWISKLNSKKLQKLMDATTWMDADEALAFGLITEVSDPVTVENRFDAGLEGLADTVPDKYKDRVRALFKECGCTGPTAGAEFADLANAAIDQRIEEEDETERNDIIAELVASTGETEETIEEILTGELECPAEEVVAGFVEVLPITQEQADTALEADGCTDEDDEEDEEEETEEETEEEETDAGDGAGEEPDAGAAGADSQIKAQVGAGGKMERKTNGEDKGAIRAAEKNRIVGINKVAEAAVKAGLDGEAWQKRAAEAIENDTAVDTFRAELVDAVAEKAEAGGGPGGTPSGAGVTAGEDERDKRVAGIRAALWARAGVTDTIRSASRKKPDDPAFQNIALDPGQFRGLTLLDHARNVVERAKPGASAGLSKMELAGTFLRNSAGQQTTSDFAIALEDALHKTLLAAFAIAPDQWRKFCKVGTVSDFRAHSRHQNGFLSRLDQVYESGEYNNKTVPDTEKQTQQAVTYGNILALSRQAIINDDMGVFSDLAVRLGLAAGLSIELGVFDLLKLNAGLGPAMADSNPLFDASHGNIAGGAAISVAALDADRVKMAQQTDASGNVYLDLRPAVLVVPIGLGGQARVLNDSQYDVDATTSLQTPNKVRGLYRDIADSPHLTGTRRYSFADPAIAPVIEVAFLEGEQAPFMEMQDGWRVDGAEWKVRHDFGIAAISYRGAVTDAGA